MISDQAFSGWSLGDRDPEFIKAAMVNWGWFYEHYFRVQSDGWEHVPQEGPALVVGTHNGGITAPDMIMTMYDWFRRFGVYRPCYGLMHPLIWEVYPGIAPWAVRCGAVRAHPQPAIAALKSGATVLVYPGGAQDVFRPFWRKHQIEMAGRKGFIKLALRQEVPIIPLISVGAHETLVVLGDFYPLLDELLKRFKITKPFTGALDPQIWPLYLGLPWGVCLGPMFNIPWPNAIRLRVCPPIEFPRYGRKAASDRDYVDRCYDQVVQSMQSHLDQLVQETYG